ncbi:CPBP family intramembrane glutamic endopeptidase [Umezawaea sp. Da 62-37]|uniref:CPBP family intramembrane glutamic endopeptidase n=1 Tax=Umezawaea sp. Da 62-37 TaxID=3075927 RepID=UPI0028F70C7E|nr:CPBP family intramembrane glutamic endopeptidase [Umezawaea sp. Da 62-37]WNV85588.1 CPBP family intramembrane glutamic endopeptidase [Umezawaea sp. Da 62-37]
MTSNHTDGSGRAPSNRWQALVQRFPLITFFTLANGISWLVWVPYILSLDGFGVLHFRYPDLLVGNQLTAILPGAYLGPLTAAFTVTAITEGREGLRRWRRRLFQFRAGVAWYAFALLAVPIAVLLGTVAAFGEEAVRVPSIMVLAVYVPMLVLQFFTTGLAEEPGWRDFALSRLQQRHQPMVATFVLGVLWIIWHLPLFLTPWAGPDVTPVTVVRFAIMAMEMSFLITLVYNKGRQSLPLVMLLHCSINNFQSVAFSEFFPGTDDTLLWGPVLGLGTLSVIVIVATKGKLGYTAPVTGPVEVKTRAVA